MPQPTSATANSKRPRFGWPMRIFLTLIVGNMIFHSLANIVGYHAWRKQLSMPRYPTGLPAWREIEELKEKHALGERVLQSVRSMAAFASPWPDDKVRAKIDSWEAAGQYAVVWLGTRAGFCERLLGLGQNWTMFSPSVMRYKDVARARLLFADASTRDIRLQGDPADPACYTRLGSYRVLSYEGELHKDDADSHWGYCNLLAHRHSVNEHGARLRSIYLYKFRYTYPDPNSDAASAWQRQAGPPGWDQSAPIFKFSVPKEGR